jgi:predicted acyltransferase
VRSFSKHLDTPDTPSTLKPETEPLLKLRATAIASRSALLQQALCTHATPKPTSTLAKAGGYGHAAPRSAQLQQALYTQGGFFLARAEPLLTQAAGYGIATDDFK